VIFVESFTKSGDATNTRGLVSSWLLVKSESRLALNQKYGDRNLDSQPKIASDVDVKAM